MQLKVLFGRKSHGLPDFREKKQQQSRVFSGVIFMFTLTWTKEKELKSELLKKKETNFVERKT